jgi:hypothetical protein
LDHRASAPPSALIRIPDPASAQLNSPSQQRSVSSSITCKFVRRNLIAIKRTIAGFATHCDRISQGHLSVDSGGSDKMAAQIPQKSGAIAFVSALIASCLGVGVPANTARAVDCLTVPNSSAPPNDHWYYRTDRAKQRKCWYLRAANRPSQEVAVRIARQAPPSESLQPAPAASPHSLANFKDFMESAEAPIYPTNTSKNYTPSS